MGLFSENDSEAERLERAIKTGLDILDERERCATPANRAEDRRFWDGARALIYRYKRDANRTIEKEKREDLILRVAGGTIVLITLGLAIKLLYIKYSDPDIVRTTFNVGGEDIPSEYKVITRDFTHKVHDKLELSNEVKFIAIPHQGIQITATTDHETDWLLKGPITIEVTGARITCMPDSQGVLVEEDPIETVTFDLKNCEYYGFNTP